MSAWYVAGYSGEGTLIVDDERVVAVVKAGDAVELIRSAPDLLEIAKAVYAGGMSYPKYLRDKAAAAIAKAEGGQP
ncbi:MAG TPA: hypothetical protein VNQ90_17815 [Chthoniobacteraceae bacterium]|nr:hypothetical protein [Chthoniobacteraceae bacterium]